MYGLSKYSVIAIFALTCGWYAMIRIGARCPNQAEGNVPRRRGSGRCECVLRVQAGVWSGRPRRWRPAPADRCGASALGAAIFVCRTPVDTGRSDNGHREDTRSNRALLQPTYNSGRTLSSAQPSGRTIKECPLPSPVRYF